MTTLAQADARRRVTLPMASGIKAGDAIEMEVMEDGRVVVTPIVTIPRAQLWAWQPSVRERVAASLADKRPSINLTKPGALEKLAAELGVDPAVLK